ncbi:MAG TPA: methyltransferase domain-containing protein [Burkholderiales bacterium]|nr:methyltransferase domain-containing protein [Burkholderiales bacterium]
MRQALGIDALSGVYARLAQRYDWQHRLLTVAADQRGRQMLIERCVRAGDRVLDAGAGTGSTALLAARKAGREGKVTLFDLSDDMLEVARDKAALAGLEERLEFYTGDMVRLPFPEAFFDVVLSTYSLCPLYDPAKAAQELFRVLRPGGKLGVAHSVEPQNSATKWLADKIENIAWRFPLVSMGCRAVDVLPTLEAAGGRVVFLKHIGVPLWPFAVLVVEKPAPPKSDHFRMGDVSINVPLRA